MGIEVFEKINNMLKGTGYNKEITNLADLGDFIGDKNNMDLKVYNDLKDIYNELMLGAGMW
ncbi:MAG: hypothetical protein N3B21_15660 [Clostridia bacterium]|nr:hypothetical protein [Clostridia bacterium]